MLYHGYLFWPLIQVMLVGVLNQTLAQKEQQIILECFVVDLKQIPVSNKDKESVSFMYNRFWMKRKTKKLMLCCVLCNSFYTLPRPHDVVLFGSQDYDACCFWCNTASILLFAWPWMMWLLICLRYNCDSVTWLLLLSHDWVTHHRISKKFWFCLFDCS